MAAIIGNIPDIIFSSQFPNKLPLNCESDSLITVRLSYGAQPIYQSFITPLNGEAYIYEFADLINDYCITHNLCYASWKLETWQDEEHEIKLFATIFNAQSTEIDAATAAKLNFLCAAPARICGYDTTEFLNAFLTPSEPSVVNEYIMYSYNNGIDKALHLTFDAGPVLSNKIETLEYTYYALRQAVLNSSDEYTDEELITVKAVTVNLGERSATIYFAPLPRQLSIFFRNAYNVWEHAHLHCVNTRKASTDRDIAIIGNNAQIYNAANSVVLEVETQPLSLRDALAFEQVLLSHDVRVATPRVDYSEESFGEYVPDNMPQILITDFTSEISDADEKLTSFKFSYRFVPNNPPLAQETLELEEDKIFTDQYNNQFS